MDCLIIKKKFLNLIFDNNKTWEIRGSKTNKVGKIGLIESGSKEIKGEANIVGCVGPLNKEELILNKDKHQVEDVNNISYKKVYAWILKESVRYDVPKKYNHPNGAIIWVKV
jgi:hypothetical protein